MPKVCYLSPISIHSVRYLEAFKQKGYDVSIVADSRTWVAPHPQSVPVYFLPRLTRRNFPYRYILNIQTAMRILRKIRPDFVHLHAQHYYSPAMILSGIPFILTSWGTEVLTLPDENILIRTSSRIAALKASKVTVDANCLKTIWLRFGIPAQKVEIIPFGVDLNVFNPQVDGSEVRQALGIQNGDIVFISTRALHNHHYNVETFIQAMPSIIKSCSNVKFIVKGTGPLETHLRKLVTKLGLSDHVRFVGFVPHDQLSKYLAAADIYVSTCFVDTTSVSLLEAMACGLAPLVTDIIGNREWIKDGVNGSLFPPQDSQALAQKAIQLIENKETRRRYGELCLETVKQRAAWKDCVARMERIYQSFPNRS